MNIRNFLGCPQAAKWYSQTADKEIHPRSHSQHLIDMNTLDHRPNSTRRNNPLA